MPKTGATRYQKFLKSEKAKTKLKSKELPKGTNVTKTNFKVKKIVIKEQLKKHDQTEFLSSKKLNLQELLMRLNHFNTNSRTEALSGLKELITCHSNILNQNLGIILHKITPLILNIEKVIRRETFKVLHLILSNITTGKLVAFFSFLSTYLRSAMTHIDNNIQEDSLLFLDILLLCAPEYVVQDFHKILPNFLDMISKLRIDSNPGRTLIITIDNKNTSVKWRVKVLHRLQDFLCKFVDHNVIHEKKNVTHQYEKNKLNFYNLFDQRYLSNTSMTVLKISDSHNNVMDEAGIFSSYIDTLMPLLFEILVEVQPNENNQRTTENMLTEDAAILLKYVLRIISLIIIHIKYLHKKGLTTDLQKMFYNKYRKQFNDNIMKGFPYLTTVRTGRVQQTATARIFEELTDPQMFVENLEICRLFINFNPHTNFKIQNKQAISVVNYLNKTFNNANPNVNKVMISVLESIFCNELTGWTKNIQVIDSLFKKLVLAYVNCSKCNILLEEYFCLLCKISLNDKLNQFHNTNNEWLTHMPDILLQPTISSESVNMLHKFCVCRNKVFNDFVKDKQVEIIRNLPLIKINDGGKEDTDLVYYKLYSSLFYYIKKWHAEALNLLQNQILDEMYSDNHCKYIMNMLNFRNEINRQALDNQVFISIKS